MTGGSIMIGAAGDVMLVGEGRSGDEAMAKNIVVFSDGTGQDGGKRHNSNVYKLFNMIEDRTSDQVAFYDRGLGTGWRKLTGNSAGMGISHNIKECYEFIFEQFEAGDDIYLFGFSRGATTVRSLSGFIHLFGILPKSRPELIDEAWDIYTIKTTRRERRQVEPGQWRRNVRARAFIDRHHTMWTRIRFVGVWDTVTALGVPIRAISNVLDKIPLFRHQFHDLTLSASVENGYHALAIDDERKTFHPLLWEADRLEEYQTLKQVWFSGMHTDVGGGYPVAELSDIPLKWMIASAEYFGLRIYPRNRVAPTLNPRADGKMHDSRGGRFTRFYQRAPRFWPMERPDRPCVHRSVLDRRAALADTANPYEPWILAEDYTIDETPYR
jgi:uncharacterized protein (DUF2235 family)